MKLSEAIRAGAKLRPQSFVAFFGYVDDYALGSCALGAAVEAVKGKPVPCEVHYQLPDFIGETFDGVYRQVACPAEGCRKHQPTELLYMAMELNDSHHWTRERIAEWVERQGA